MTLPDMDTASALHDPEKRDPPQGETFEGMTERQVRSGIDDLVTLHGFEEARKLIALWLWKAAENRKEAA